MLLLSTYYGILRKHQTFLHSNVHVKILIQFITWFDSLLIVVLFRNLTHEKVWSLFWKRIWSCNTTLIQAGMTYGLSVSSSNFPSLTADMMHHTRIHVFGTFSLTAVWFLSAGILLSMGGERGVFVIFFPRTFSRVEFFFCSMPVQFLPAGWSCEWAVVKFYPTHLSSTTGPLRVQFDASISSSLHIAGTLVVAPVMGSLPPNVE